MARQNPLYFRSMSPSSQANVFPFPASPLLAGLLLRVRAR